MHIAPDAVFLPPHDKGDLAVRFQSDKTVDDMAARLLQHFRPDDIIFLIEARLELDEHSHLLTVFRRLCQRRDDGRIAADTVEGLLYGKHLRVSRRLSDKVYHGRKGLVGMVQQNISLSDLVKDIAASRQLRHLLGRILRCL